MLDQSFLEHVVESGVNAFHHVLEEDSVAFLNTDFDLFEIVIVFSVSDYEVLMQILQPFVTLHLGVNIKGPSKTSSDEDTILN
jgi:hypothetical protein